MKRFFFLSISIFLFQSSQAQKDSANTGTGLLYGYNNAYYLTAPVGWVMDNENGKEQGLTAVFYPKGSTWAEGETVMYTTFTNFDTTKTETINDIIRGDSTEFKMHSPQLSTKKQDPILIGKNKKAIVIAYTGDVNGNYEEVAYIPEKKGVVMIILTSRNKNGCINYHKDFEALVKSYRFLTDKVNINIAK